MIISEHPKFSTHDKYEEKSEVRDDLENQDNLRYSNGLHRLGILKGLLTLLFSISLLLSLTLATEKGSDLLLEVWNSYNQHTCIIHNTCHNITINDFFKPIEFNSSKVSEIYYYKSINLKPIAAYSTSRNSFSEWIEQQSNVAYNKVLSNIADKNILNNQNLYKLNGNIKDGVIVASPSTEHPDYFYQWVRDSSISIDTVLQNIFMDSNVNITLVGTYLKYLQNSFNLQRSNSRSGNGVPSNDFLSLGEPKWNVDSTPFNDPWGRPQNDGPALRAISVFKFLMLLKEYNQEFGKNLTLQDLISQYNNYFLNDNINLPFSNEKELFDNIIYWDLSFINKNWEKDNFDLWEEVYGKHFFTSLVQLSAIKISINYLKENNKSWSAMDDDNLINYNSLLINSERTFNDMYKFIMIDSGYINSNKNFIVETPSILNKRSGLDIAIIISSVITHFEQNIFSNEIPFDVNDSGILNTLYYLIQKMSILYPINHSNAKLNMGVALGRYPEDVYDGDGTSEGNPWFLATSYSSEILYKLINNINSSGNDITIPLNSWDSQFWTLIFEGLEESLDNAEEAKYQLVIPFNSPAFKQTMSTLFQLSESFLDKIRQHTSDKGDMSEQFNKYTGFMQGATDLTWSYSSFWAACHERSKILDIV